MTNRLRALVLLLAHTPGILFGLNQRACPLAWEHIAHTRAHAKAEHIGLANINVADHAPPELLTESPFATLAESKRPAYARIFQDTYAGFERMRGENGLIMDTVHLRQDGKGGFALRKYKTEAAPTDIGLDLIVQSGLIGNEALGSHAAQSLDRVLTAMEKLPYHEASGLFYRLYETNLVIGSPVLSRDVSSVDNLHLAVGLWTAAQKLGRYPEGDPRRALAARARVLFDRMDFSPFLDESSGLIGGNLQYKEGAWKLEPARYRFGSEARSLYTVGYALGLFRKNPEGPFRALGGVPMEWVRDPGEPGNMAVWDGGVFQQFLPRAIANEELYSRVMRRNASSAAIFVEKFGERVVVAGNRVVRVPAAPTASVVEVREPAGGKVEILYSGKVGVAAWQEEMNRDTVTGRLIVPHAILLAASVHPGRTSEALKELGEIRSGDNHFYLPGFGFTASLRLFPAASRDGSLPVVNSAGVGVDKGIELLSLMQILDPAGLSPSGRALLEDPAAGARLSRAFSVIDARWRLSQGYEE